MSGRWGGERMNSKRCYQVFGRGHPERCFVAQCVTEKMAHYLGALYVLERGGSYTITEVDVTRTGSRHFRLWDGSIPRDIEQLAVRVNIRRNRRVREGLVLSRRGRLV